MTSGGKGHPHEVESGGTPARGLRMDAMVWSGGIGGGSVGGRCGRRYGVGGPIRGAWIRSVL